MESRNNRYFYKAFGFSIASELPLREALPLHNLKEAQITIIKGNLSEKGKDFKSDRTQFSVMENEVLFQIPQVGRFLVKDGKEITFSPLEGATDAHLRLYLLGTCMGAILLQRKILPLHGSAIVINGKAYAIVGHSGAGKSTTASALTNKGYKLLSDDVIPIVLNENNIPFVTPAYPQQKLWQTSLEAFNIHVHNYERVVERESKFAIPVNEQFSQESVPLAGIIELMKTEEDKVSINPIQNLDRFQILYSHTYRNFLLQPAGLLQWHFHMSTAIVNKLKFYQLKRTTNRFTAEEVSQLILAITENEEVKAW